MEAEIIKLEQQVDPLANANNHYKMMVEFVKMQMKKDVDFGTIPGTNNKPVLLKPGAEKLCRLFSLYPQLELVQSITDFDKPLFHYHYKCTIYRHGEPIGQGDGCCNSKEKKYESQKYRVYDLVNTITKIAQKRAMVSAVLVAVGASEFFTCDLESDVIEENKANSKLKSDNNLITDAQVKRFRAIATRAGYTTQGAKALLASYGFSSSKEITTTVYDSICEKAGDASMMAAFNQKG